MAKRSEYNPSTRTISLRRNASVYEIAHESAHATQHRRQTIPWRLAVATRSVPYLARLTNLLVEIQAARMALATLRSDGISSPCHSHEARKALRSYAIACFGWG